MVMGLTLNYKWKGVIMSCKDFNGVAGAGSRRRCEDVAGDFGRKRCNEVAGDFSRRRCECVFECLLELLEDAGERNNHHCCHRNGSSVSPNGGSTRRRCDCDCVFECLIELLEDASEEEFCRCPR